jgi:hypothetical protein
MDDAPGIDEVGVGDRGNARKIGDQLVLDIDGGSRGGRRIQSAPLERFESMAEILP